MRDFFCLILLLICMKWPVTADSRTPCNCAVHPYPPTGEDSTPSPILVGPYVWSFVSEPDLHPMKVDVLVNKKKSAQGFIFLGPYASSADAMYGQTGALIMARDGTPIWFRPLSSPNLMNIDFRVQKLFGSPVLTFWQGTVATSPVYTNFPSGSSEPGSCYYILDQTYRVIKTIQAQRGFISDVHEFLLTPQNSALFLATKKIPMDLTPYGGPAEGFIQDFSIQEVDVATGKLLFFWDALEHIPLTESFEPASNATQTGDVWDVYHLNSLGLTEEKDAILLSGRNTWTIYKIDKPTGKIKWRLGGKNSDFSFEEQATFSWQHDARLIGANTLSLFDDNCCENSADIPPQTPPAHGLILKLNYRNLSASAEKTYFHDPQLQVASQGNLQSLKNGNKFIGWGQKSYFSEYKQAGNSALYPQKNSVYDAQMPGNNISYRAYCYKWKARPYYRPKIAAVQSEGKTDLFVSWNGSTETSAWKIYGGETPQNLKKITTVPKSGFETKVGVDSNFAYFQAKALNAAGQSLGKSRIIKIAE